MLRRRPIAAIALALALQAGVPATALAQTLPGYGRPLSPAEGRDLKAAVARLSGELKVREATLFAVADRVGLDLKGRPFVDVLKLLEAKAQEAATLKAQVAALEERVATLSDPALRDPARQQLNQAMKAIDEGRLEAADEHLAAVAELRWPQSVEARQAWLEAVRNRAALARLRLDEDSAASLLRAARLEERRLSAMAQWQLAMDEADALYEKGYRRGDAAALRQAISIYADEALPLAPRAERPLDWARTQAELGVPLRLLGQRQGNFDLIEQAVAAYRAGLEEATRERHPTQWATLQNNLGTALSTLSQRDGSPERLQEAIVAYRAALQVRTREKTPGDWATTQHNLGTTLLNLAQRGGDVGQAREAVAAFRAALEVRTRERTPFEWAHGQNNLGNALLVLADLEGDAAGFEAAASAYAAALEVRTRDRVPLDWAITQNNIGNAWYGLGTMSQGTAELERAAVSYSAALEELSPERSPVDRASTQNNLGGALTVLGERTGDKTRLAEAIATLRLSIDGRPRDRFPLDWAMAQLNLGNAALSLARLSEGTADVDIAIAAFRASLEENTRERTPLAWARTTVGLAQALELKFERTGKKALLSEALETIRPVPATLEALGATGDLAATREVVARIEARKR